MPRRVSRNFSSCLRSYPLQDSWPDLGGWKKWALRPPSVTSVRYQWKGSKEGGLWMGTKKKKWKGREISKVEEQRGRIKEEERIQMIFLFLENQSL